MRALSTSLILALSLLLAACATPPAPRSGAHEALFADTLFGAPTEKVGTEDIFAVDDAMRAYVKTEVTRLARKHGLQRGLIEALYKNGQLSLDYDAEVTRNAAEAFESRSGNCLSLVILTAALARELGLTVRYQSAYLEEQWSRKGDLLLRNGHVNVTLGQPTPLGRRNPSPGGEWYAYELMVDFLPAEQLRGLKTVEIPESLVVAMYLNNRAVEALVEGRLNDAYAWVREAVQADPRFLAAQNTLGVVYLRRGALPQARAVFEQVLAADSNHTRALANLLQVAARQDRTEEAARLRERLVRLEPEPPLHFYNLGLAAMQRQDFRAARDLFTKEAARGDANAEVYFQLGVAHYRLGDLERAARALSLATEASASRGERGLYASKLAWLRARQAH